MGGWERRPWGFSEYITELDRIQIANGLMDENNLAAQKRM